MILEVLFVSTDGIKNESGYQIVTVYILFK